MNDLTEPSTTKSEPSRSQRVRPAGPLGVGSGLTRRRVLQISGAAVAAGSAAVGVTTLTTRGADRIGPHSPEVLAAERARLSTGSVAHHRLTAAPSTVDLAGRTARTWTFDGTLPARGIHVNAGQQLRVDVSNQLPAPTTVHWHGLGLRNDMDGVPGLTMGAIKPGGSFRYQFTVPDPGTYWFHPHVGVQLDTGLMGPLVVEDPHEPLAYDQDVTLVLDDWTDGVGGSPTDVLTDLRTNGMKEMSGMAPGSMSSDSTRGAASRAHPLGRDTGDVAYPLHLVNGRPPNDPYVLTTKVGRRLRLRLINAGSDTAYRFALGGHRLTVVAADGYPVRPVDVDAIVLGMGERYDVLVTAQDGVFPLLARPEGKRDRDAFAVVRAGSGRTPRPMAPGLDGRLLSYDDLAPTDAATMSLRRVDRTLDVALEMKAGGRRWLINGASYADHEPLNVKAGERVRLRLRNQTMMFHPMHLHGHTFAIVRHGRAGLRKDTVNVLPKQQVEVDVDADNPGQWLVHCHNAYHGELGMMSVLSYVR